MLAMVVDDAKVARKMVAKMVESLGFEVVTAEHGQDALDKMTPDNPPDAIVTDWNMPVMDGVDFAKQVRRTAAFANVPILMVSSEADPRRVAKALLAGVDEYLFKPVDAGMIRERLEVMGVYTANIS